MPPPTHRLSSLAFRFSGGLAFLSVLFGATVVIGYLLDNPDMKGLLEGWRPMKPNTALCFIFNGLALICSLVPESRTLAARFGPGIRTLRLGTGLAIPPILLSLTSLAEYATGNDLGIDDLLYQLSPAPQVSPGSYRMALETALCHTLLSVALILNTQRQKSRRAVLLASFCSLLVISIAIAAVGTYLSPLLGLLGWIGLPMMAADSALLMVFLGLSVFLVTCTQRAFSWELGKRVTTGFLCGMIVLGVIFLTTIRSQYQVSQINAQMEEHEALFAKSADTLAMASHQHSLTLAFLVSDDLNHLNAAIINADQTRVRLDEFDQYRKKHSDSDSWRYLPVMTRSQDLVAWSTQAVATSRQGMSPAQLHAEIKQGNLLFDKLKIGFDQSESEHRHMMSEMRRKSDYVRKTAFVTIACGMLANLIVFSFVFLRLNRVMSEQHRVKTELIEREQQYRTLANSGQALIWTAGTDTLCNYFNDIWLEFTGRTLEQELGNGWAEGVHPDDLEHCVQTYLSAFERRKKFSMDYRLRRHDGEYRWIQDEGAPRFDAHGNFIGYIGFCLDITERKLAESAMQESELRFRKLFGEIPSVAVQGYGADLVTHYWNQASERLYGFTAEEAIGRKLTDLIIPSEMRDEVRESVTAMMSTGKPLATQELTLMCKDGSRISVISSHAVVAVPDKPPELFCVDIDISQRKKIEAELEQYHNHLQTLVEERTAELADARDAAEAANRAKSSFLANMSHEIRTPMNAIIGFGHLLRRELGDSAAQGKVDKIMDAAQHLLGIINNILDLSKIEAGRLSIEEKAFSPGTVINNTLTMISDRAAAKGLRIHRAIYPSVPEQAVGDSLRVSQILINYVSNAIKFSEHGDIWVRLKLESEDASSVMLRLEVEDPGIGLSPEQQRRIFQAFVQADGSTTRRFGGSGLGLVISRHLADSMGGDTGVESQLGSGSLFWATFRLKKVSTNNVTTPGNDPQPSADEILRTRFGGLSALLVEDDPTSREIAAELLRLAGLSVDTANDGFEAVDMARRQDYPLIIMDMQMPGMGGIEATRAIRKLPGKSAEAIIIAMTANAFEEDRRQCVDAGMNDHLAKPVEATLLYATILRWLDKT